MPSQARDRIDRSGNSPSIRRAPPSRGRSLLALQAMLIAAVPIAMLAPTGGETMLALPIVPASPARTANWAIGAGARLVGGGPYAGALFLAGDRWRLTTAALAHGALLIRADAGGCIAPRKRYDR